MPKEIFKALKNYVSTSFDEYIMETEIKDLSHVGYRNFMINRLKERIEREELEEDY